MGRFLPSFFHGVLTKWRTLGGRVAEWLRRFQKCALCTLRAHGDFLRARSLLLCIRDPYLPTDPWASKQARVRGSKDVLSSRVISFRREDCDLRAARTRKGVRRRASRTKHLSGHATGEGPRGAFTPHGAWGGRGDGEGGGGRGDGHRLAGPVSCHGRYRIVSQMQANRPWIGFLLATACIAASLLRRAVGLWPLPLLFSRPVQHRFPDA